MNSMVFIFTTHIVQVLAFFLQTLSSPGDSDEKNLKLFALNINTEVGTMNQSFKFILPSKYFKFFDIEYSKRPEIKRDILPKTESNEIAQALFVCLERVRTSISEPRIIKKFLKYHIRVAQIYQDNGQLVALTNFKIKNRDSVDVEELKLLPHLEELLRYCKRYNREYGTVYTELFGQYDEIRQEINIHENLVKQSITTFFCLLLKSFLEKNHQISLKLPTQKENLLTKKALLYQFIGRHSLEIRKYYGSSSEYILTGAEKQFQSWIAQRLPYEDFLALKPKIKEIDDSIGRKFDILKQKFVELQQEKIQILIEDSNNFRFMVKEIENGLSWMIPLETLSCFSKAIYLGKVLYNCEFREDCTTDDSCALFISAVFIMRLKNCYSIIKYLKHFLRGIQQNDTKFLTSVEYETIGNLHKIGKKLHEILKKEDN